MRSPRHYRSPRSPASSAIASVSSLSLTKSSPRAAPRSTRSSIAHLSDALYDLEPRFEESNYTRAFAYLRHHLHKRSLIVFLTDVIDPIAQAR